MPIAYVYSKVIDPPVSDLAGIVSKLPQGYTPYMVKAKEPNFVDSHVGNRLLVRRKQLKMSQETLADHIGVTFQQVQKYERGTNRISASRLWRLCETLDVEPGYFFDGLERGEAPIADKDPKRASAVSHFMASSQGTSLALALDRIEDVELKAQLVKLIQAIAEAQPDSE